MEAAKELLDRFPIEKIFLIATFGLLVIISFPYDIFKLFEMCVPAPTALTNMTTLTNATISTNQTTLDYLKGNFTPFTNAYYLGADFPLGLLKILLLSLALGVVAYFLYDIFNKVNHFPKRVYYWIKKKSPPSHDTRIEEQLAYIDWIKKRGFGKYLDFSLSMNSVATGLFWGAEIFSLVALVSLSIAAYTGNGYHYERFLHAIWVIGTYLLFKADKSRATELNNEWLRAFWPEELKRLKKLLDDSDITQKEYKKAEREILKELEHVRKKRSSRKGKPSSAAETPQS